MIQWHLKLNNARWISIFFIQELNSPACGVFTQSGVGKVYVEPSTWSDTCLQHLTRLTRPQWQKWLWLIRCPSKKKKTHKHTWWPLSEHMIVSSHKNISNTTLHSKTEIKVRLGPKTKQIKHHTVNGCIIIQRQDRLMSAFLNTSTHFRC